MLALPLPADERHVLPLWRNLSFQLLWVSAAASGLGNRMVELAALPLLGVVREHAQASSITSAIYFWYFLPWLFITPLGGWLADTLPRKWILLACEEGRAAALLLACVLAPAGVALTTHGARHLLPLPGDERWAVFALLAGLGLLAAVYTPTRNALVPQLVKVTQFSLANATIMGISVLAALTGYLIGGFLLTHHSVRAGLLLAFLAYATSGLFFAAMRVPPRHGLDTDRHLSAAARLASAGRYLAHHRPVRQLVLLNALVWTMAMIVVTSIAALCKERYGLPADRFVAHFALLNMMVGAGMLTGAAWVGWVNPRREASVLLLGVLLVTCVFLVGLGINHSYPAALGLGFGVGFGGGSALVTIAALTQAITPNFILGRVSGVRELLSNAVQVLVNLLVWQLPWLRWHALRVSAHHRTLSEAVALVLPETDTMLMGALYPLAAVLAAVAIWGLWRQLDRGPMVARGANALWHLDRLYAVVWHRLRWVERDAIPRTGPVILAANHTTALDPLLIQAATPRLVTWVMLRPYQFRWLGFVWRLLHPVALERGSANLAELRQILARLKAGEAVGLFPEGGLPSEYEGAGEALRPFAPGVAMLAVRSGALVVPVWIAGTPRTPSMILHLLLPSRSEVVFGRPYRPDPAWSYPQIAEDLRRRVAELGQATEQRSGQRLEVRGQGGAEMGTI